MSSRDLCVLLPVQQGVMKRQKSTNNKSRSMNMVRFFKKVYDQIVWNILAIIHCDSQHEAPVPSSLSSGGSRVSNAGVSLPPWVDMPDDWTAGDLGGPPASDEHYYQHLQDDEVLDAE